MRFRSPAEAKAMRKQNAAIVFTAGLIIAAFVSIPIVNLATPLFGMALHGPHAQAAVRAAAGADRAGGERRECRWLKSAFDSSFRDASREAIQTRTTARIAFRVRMLCIAPE